MPNSTNPASSPTGQPLSSAPQLTPLVTWLVYIIAALGFAFDTYTLLTMPLIARPALAELLQVNPATPQGNVSYRWSTDQSLPLIQCSRGSPCTELHGIGSDQMQAKSENPLVAQCKFRAVTYPKARSGTPLAQRCSLPIVAGIKDLGNRPWSGVERQRAGTPSVNPLVIGSIRRPPDGLVGALIEGALRTFTTAGARLTFVLSNPKLTPFNWWCSAPPTTYSPAVREQRSLSQGRFLTPFETFASDRNRAVEVAETDHQPFTTEHIGIS